METARFQITRIERQKNQPERVSVFLDGAYAFGLKRDVLISRHLHEGDSVSQQVLDELLFAEEREKAKEKALLFLSYRARSVREIRDKLKEKGFSGKAADAVVEDFLRVGLLDDRQFAVSFARTRMVQKPVSRTLLMRELRRKGIDEETAEEAVDATYEGKTERGIAGELFRKRLNRLTVNDQNEKKIKKRLSDFLMRRGFGYHVIADVIREEWQQSL